MNWRPAKSLIELRNQVNAVWPTRDKSSDGLIGDASHQATHSEHNPDEHGVVRAIDITNDPAHGLVSRKLAEALAASRDARILYIISNRQICSSQVNPWQWREYHGSNPHTEHMHLSVVSDPQKYDDETPWKILASTEPTNGWQSGKGSWYSQYQGKYSWHDSGDAPGSNALGVPDSCQGVSFYRHDTLGHWFEVKAPNGFVSKEQQTDIGPAPWTHRAIDISSAAAERFGYSPQSFPTDGTFSWRMIDPPKEVAGLPVRQQATKYASIRKGS